MTVSFCDKFSYKTDEFEENGFGLVERLFPELIYVAETALAPVNYFPFLMKILISPKLILELFFLVQLLLNLKLYGTQTLYLVGRQVLFLKLRRDG